MSTEYRNNHYVPIWYQRRFLTSDLPTREIVYRDLQPGEVRDRRGRFHRLPEIHRQGPRKCFVERDLYTTFLAEEPSTLLEQGLLGQIDQAGKRAVERFAEFSFASADLEAFHGLLEYMGTQKLRTPKGLGWLSELVGSRNRASILGRMVELRQMYSAIWSECVWQIADAAQSDTKFIISDHPVTVYNRRCGPSSKWCRGFNDPNVLLHASHTLFPLSLEKLLILTNLSWARNPYQSEVGMRPNPNLARGGVFKLTDVQTERNLSEQEVREVNFILRSRAFRYIGAAKEEWLYPEEHVSKSHWPDFGDGYLLMPDPRSLHIGGTVLMGYDSGRTDAFDEYGRKPWDPDYQTGSGSDESAALDRFKGEFARLLGPRRRGRTWQFGELEPESYSSDLHERYLGLEDENRRVMRRRGSR